MDLESFNIGFLVMRGAISPESGKLALLNNQKKERNCGQKVKRTVRIIMSRACGDVSK